MPDGDGDDDGDDGRHPQLLHLTANDWCGVAVVGDVDDDVAVAVVHVDDVVDVVGAVVVVVVVGGDDGGVVVAAVDLLQRLQLPP